MTASGLAWEDVLAQVEADVLSTESLLSARSDQPPAPRELAPAEMMLPASADSPFGSGIGISGPDLPELSAMPPVPPELLERVAVLRNRIEALRVEIKAEMINLQTMTARIEAQRRLAIKNEVMPRFVDRAL
jgi:hypothetical protein